MRHMRTIALLLCSTSVFADVHDTIPDRYTGRWGASLDRGSMVVFAVSKDTAEMIIVL